MRNCIKFLLALPLMVSCNSQPNTESTADAPPLTLKAVTEGSGSQSAPTENEIARAKQRDLEKKYNLGSGALIDITGIVGKNLTVVEKKLGKPDNIEKARPSGTPCVNGGCNRAYFQGGHYEVLFISGKADWITINDMSAFDLNTGSIKLIGLPNSQPSFSNSSVIRWANVKGIKEISFFNNGSDKIDYIYIKAKTK